MNKNKVTIYTDGGAEPNPGPGGWGAVLLLEKDGDSHTKELKGGEPQTTNNRMELKAAIEALKALEGSHEIVFFTDSQYLQKGITEWMVSWKKSNFKNGKLPNADLWHLLNTEVANHDIHWEWVKGHANNKYNERADVLATVGRSEGLGLPVSDVVLSEPHRIYIQTIGSSSENPGLWEALVEMEEKQTHLSGQEFNAGLQRLHLLAAIAALEAVPEQATAHLFTNSDYLRDGLQGWIRGWKRNGWRTRDGNEVKHRELWEKLDKLTDSRKLRISSIEESDYHINLLHNNLKRTKAAFEDD